MSVVPSEEQMLEAIRQVQSVDGPHIGLSKLHERIKDVHGDWAVGEKRLRAVRRKHSLISTSSSLPETSHLKKLKLTFVGGENEPKYTFIEDIPAEYCTQSASQDVTSEFISNLVDVREHDVLKQGAPWFCQECQRRATRLFGTRPLYVFTMGNLMFTPSSSPYALFRPHRPVHKKPTVGCKNG